MFVGYECRPVAAGGRGGGCHAGCRATSVSMWKRSTRDTCIRSTSK